ncbi:bleomycin resistance protein [Paracoccus marinaquae]|uniref:Bleomycin resistance protein n=1 Tax=Paracoccus marinaquae TaxID=2841926 RepID=A0ABS6ADM6_9RHOB|nr:bleomycin resistance protein [Paracoccus marinaquae]
MALPLTVTANLPSRAFDATEDFYARLGFARAYRDDNWMILKRGEAQLEFFPHPDLDPGGSWFSACFRTEDLEGLAAEFAELNLPARGRPCLTGISRVTDDLRMFALIDPDGSLIRCLGP